MKKIRLLLASLVIAGFAFQACEDMDDTAVPVNDFIWKGLNLYYLWQEDVPNLADDRFDGAGDQERLNAHIKKTWQRRGGVIGVKCAKYQVTG